VTASPGAGHVSEASDLAAILADLGAGLPAGHVVAWAATLRASPTPRTADEGRRVAARLIDAHPGYAVGARATALVAAWRRAPGIGGSALALALEAAAQVYARHADRRTDVVVSGPVSDEVPLRLTGAVVLAAIRSARTSLLVVSFAAFGVADVVAELRRAADRGVRLDLVLETSTAAGGTLRGGRGDHGAGGAFEALRGRATFWEWPARHRPPVGAGRAALHAKLIVADGETAMLGSANLTDRGLSENLEVRVVIRDPDVAGRIARHFAALMRAAQHGWKSLTVSRSDGSD
jgi:phosphatidylserine/phosphatidylglycerophosphate/cardiolipin synthase-like enzyme